MPVASSQDIGADKAFNDILCRAFQEYLSGQLDELARSLRLTRAQRTFAEAISRRQTRAALDAGASRRRAVVTASEWARMRKVQEYRRAFV
jgi:hypothetical protein